MSHLSQTVVRRFSLSIPEAGQKNARNERRHIETSETKLKRNHIFSRANIEQKKFNSLRKKSENLAARLLQRENTIFRQKIASL